MTPPRDPRVDPQDPLPEPSFRWRRLMAFAVVAACLGLVWRLTYLIPAGDVLALCQALLVFAGLMLLLWAGGASAADITALLATLRLRLRGPYAAPPSSASGPPDPMRPYRDPVPSRAEDPAEGVEPRQDR